MRRADANRVLYKASLDGSIYGDSVLRVDWNPAINGVKLEAVLPEYYHAIWHPLDTNETIECCTAFNMDRTTAHSLYNTVGNRAYFPQGTALNPSLAIVWEYWNAYETMVAVDDQTVMKRPNPFSRPGSDGRVIPGDLPFVHIPNLGVNGEYWGFGDAEQILLLADELNYRLADIGDVINYHAHPITLLKSFYGDVTQLPVSADAVWDMGREGDAEYLEWGGPAPEVMSYIEMLLRVIMETTSLTPIAFGHTTSSQASSAALNIQMLPITEVVRRKRAFWGPSLRDLAMRMLKLESISLEQIAKGKFRKEYGFAVEDLERFEVQASFNPILPRDRQAVVNEQVALMTNHARSIITALRELGVSDPDVERQRILEDARAIAEITLEINKEMADHQNDLNIEAAEAEAEFAPKPTKIAVKSGGKNSDRAKGGSNTDGGS
jgi:hypothetical protein